MLDIYGRERHPEATSTQFIQESYNDRRQRIELMLYTFGYMSAPPANRAILVDEDPPLDQLTGPYATKVVHLYGGRPQGGFIIDLKGKIVVTQQWERPEIIDEVLSKIFGLTPGL